MNTFRTKVTEYCLTFISQSTIHPEIIAAIHMTKYGAADKNPF